MNDTAPVLITGCSSGVGRASARRFLEAPPPEDLGLDHTGLGPVSGGLDTSRASAERNSIVACLERTGRNISKSARELGVSRATLYRLLSKHSIGVRAQG